MTIKIFKNGIPEDFKSSTELPHDENQGVTWQTLNRSWWEKNPMRYDFTEKIPYPEHSPDFYREIDRRFFGSVFQFMPWDKKPFDTLVDFESLRSKSVLEIGVGNGSHAQLLSESAGSYTGIDLTNYAVSSTRKRLEIFKTRGKILRMDAEKLGFADSSFDLVWSWGVIHHSADTQRILSEIHRVLKPGGKAIIMVYHRSFWNTYIRGALYYGCLRGGFLKTGSLTTIIQQSTDGAIARYYTVAEWRNLLSRLFTVENISVYGSKSQIIPLPWGKTKEFLMRLIPDSLGRAITNRPLMGFLLVSSCRKDS